MKKIKVYLSVEESLESDKLEISNFIRDLNERYKKNSNLYFQLLTKKDKIKEEEIKESELFFILFQNDLNESNKKEFDIAYQTFEKESMPKITTYIRNGAKKESSSVLEFLTYLDEKLGHYIMNMKILILLN